MVEDIDTRVEWLDSEEYDHDEYDEYDYEEYDHKDVISLSKRIRRE
jgi:hypothetical protein